MNPEFAMRRRLWVAALGETDAATGSSEPNAISRSLALMVWKAKIAQIAFAAWDFAPRDKRDVPLRNIALFRSYQNLYLESQSIAIRRQLEPGDMSARGKRDKSIQSLAALLADMKAHRHLLTRENLFASQGTPIDLESVRAYEQHQYRAAYGTSHAARIDYPVLVSERLHNCLDKLSRTAPSQRSELDVVSVTVFERLHDELISINSVCEVVNKYIAHAATLSSIGQAFGDKTPEIDADLIDRALCILLRVHAVLDGLILRGTWMAPIPMTDIDILHHLDQPIASSESCDRIKQRLAEWAKPIEAAGANVLSWISTASR